MTTSMFWQRAWRKAGEHLRSDPWGWSLIGYSFKWLLSRTKRMLAARLTGRAPERFRETAPDRFMMAVKVCGGLGDYVVFARVLRDLSLLSGALRLHVFCSSLGGGTWVFGSLPCVDGVFDDAFFHDVPRAVRCHHAPQSICQLRHGVSQFRQVDEAVKAAGSMPGQLAQVQRILGGIPSSRQPTLNGAFAHHAVVLGDNRYSFLHSQLGLVPGSLLLDLACDNSLATDLAGRFSSWITINNGFDANYVMSSRQATKCYPTAHWQTLVAGLKKRCPDVKIVQVGSKTSVPIAGVDVNLVEATTLPQAAALLRDALLHVDIEGGLVHVAASVGTRSLVLFGPTSLGYFGYPDNVNLFSGFCGNCWGVTERWMEICPRGYGSPRCLEKLDPARVLEAVVAALGATKRLRAA